MPDFIYGNFEWDINKNEANKIKHGISFEAASRIFEGRVSEKNSPYVGENRFVAIGKVNGKIIAFIYTMRGNRKRLVSARKPRTKEVIDYERWNV